MSYWRRVDLNLQRSYWRRVDLGHLKKTMTYILNLGRLGNIWEGGGGVKRFNGAL